MPNESKELEAFYELKESIEYKGGDFYCANEQRLNIIESMLKEYEEIDNQLNDLFEKFGINNREDLVEKLKALDIIKENLNNIDENAYYSVLGIFIKKPKPQEEYELLKKILTK